jgi:hypothetical protein
MSSRQSNGSLGRPETLHTQEWTAHFGHAFDLDLIGPDDF